MALVSHEAEKTGTEVARVSGNANAPIKAKKQLEAILDLRQTDLADLLPKGVSLATFRKQVYAAFVHNPALYDCTQLSVFKSIMLAAQLGLDCSGATHEAWIVPFKNKDTGNKEGTLIPGYQGLIKLARRSGTIASIFAYCVYSKDKFRRTLGLNPTIEHEPCDEADRGKLVGVYAVAKMRDGTIQYEYMTTAEVQKIRNMSRAKNAMAWTDHFDEMSRKTVIRRLCKFLDLSPEDKRAIIDLDRSEYQILDPDTKADGSPRATPADIVDAYAEPAPQLGTEDAEEAEIEAAAASDGTIPGLD